MRGQLLYIEAGQVVVVPDSGLETPPYERGGHVSLWADPSYSVRNAGTETAVVLVANLSFRSQTSAATPATEAQAAAKAQPGPLRAAVAFRDIAGPERTPPPGVKQETLLYLVVPTLPEAPVVLFLVRTTWPPDSALDGGVLTGVVGLWTEAGALLVPDPTNPGLDVRLAADEPFSVSYLPGTTIRLRNAGTEPAQVLMLGLATTDQELIIGR